MIRVIINKLFSRQIIGVVLVLRCDSDSNSSRQWVVLIEFIVLSTIHYCDFQICNSREFVKKPPLDENNDSQIIISHDDPIYSRPVL